MFSQHMFNRRGVQAEQTPPEKEMDAKHEAVAIVDEEHPHAGEKDDLVEALRNAGPAQDTLDLSVESSPYLAARLFSLPVGEKITVVLTFMVCASIVYTQCAVARADTEEKWYVPGAFGLSSIVFLCWSLTIVFLYPVHRFFLPFSITATSEKQFKAAAEFCLYMLLVFVCQNTRLIAREKKQYNRDSFCALMILLLIASLLTMRRIPPPSQRLKAPSNEDDNAMSDVMRKQTNTQADEGSAPMKEDSATVARAAVEKDAAALAPTARQEASSLLPGKGTDTGVYHISPLCREQTTEWRGWMQVLFLYYHYFYATEVYNAARLCVSAYVWMTGYGNFFFYTRRKDFGLLRFCHTMWRLNFLCLCLCCALGNQYMLYYICPMHTLFTLCVYVGLYVRQGMNVKYSGIVVKLGVLTALAVVLWDLGPLSRRLFQTVWWPFTWLLRYDNPVADAAHPLAAWFFRTRLDHLVWIAGMGFAAFQPTFDALLRRLDAMPPARGALVKAAIAAITIALAVVYTVLVYWRDRALYNKLHPFTSFIPLTLYLILRNLIQRSRMYYSALLYRLGNVTLETYLLQFHVWMSCVTVNGPPWFVLRLFGNAPMCNFVVFSCILVAMSERIFELVQHLETIVLPHNVTNSITLANICVAAAVIAGTTVLLWPGAHHYTALS